MLSVIWTWKWHNPKGTSLGIDIGQKALWNTMAHCGWVNVREGADREISLKMTGIIQAWADRNLVCQRIRKDGTQGPVKFVLITRLSFRAPLLKAWAVSNSFIEAMTLGCFRVLPGGLPKAEAGARRAELRFAAEKAVAHPEDADSDLKWRFCLTFLFL